MRNLPKTTQPSEPVFQLEKPAKERIIEASDRLFRSFGIRVSPHAIAHEAHSNVATLVKYFGHGDELVRRFVTSIIAEAEQLWRGIEADRPGNPEAQLRLWLALERDLAGRILEPAALLARIAAEMATGPKDPVLSRIEEYWQAERRRVVGLCRGAGLKDPVVAGDKLLLLVHGVRNERDAYGRFAPSRVLEQAGNDILVAHGTASRAAVDHAIE